MNYFDTQNPINPSNQQYSVSDPINFHHFQSICLNFFYVLFYEVADGFYCNIIFTTLHNTNDPPDNNDLSLPLYRTLGLSMD